MPKVDVSAITINYMCVYVYVCAMGVCVCACVRACMLNACIVIPYIGLAVYIFLVFTINFKKLWAIKCLRVSVCVCVHACMFGCVLACCIAKV